MEVKVKVDSVLTLAKDQLGEAIRQEITEALKMKNRARDIAQKEMIGGWWNLPEHIELYTEDELNLYLPRGFANQLVSGLNFYKMEVVFDDHRTNSPMGEVLRAVPTRDYQNVAIDRILLLEQGVWESPPGSGKTVGILEAIRRAGQKALIITDKTNIAEQWRSRADTFLGAELGLCGDGTWRERDITVALQQSLWSKRDELTETKWFDKWGFVCLDECHHLPANTFTEILSRFSAKYRVGVSGTPYKLPGQDDLIWATLGPKIHETPKHLLRKEGWLVKPEVKIWNTGFNYDFWPTHQCDPERGCMFAFCTRDKSKRRHQNNYAEVMTALVDDEKRNWLIATNVASEIQQGCCVMILSKRLKHLDTLQDYVRRLLGTSENLYSFTGRERTSERIEIQAKAELGRCGLFSTIADEALDIPRVDRIHLCWPTRNTDTTRQQIGRSERPHPDKTGAVINDYYDNVGPLKGQIADRVNYVYIPEGLTVHGWEVL